VAVEPAAVVDLAAGAVGPGAHEGLGDAHAATTVANTMATTPTASVRMTRFVVSGRHPASVGPVDLFAVGRRPQAGM
jgi:hypothetical protein